MFVVIELQMAGTGIIARIRRRSGLNKDRMEYKGIAKQFSIQ